MEILLNSIFHRNIKKIQEDVYDFRLFTLIKSMELIVKNQLNLENLYS